MGIDVGVHVLAAAGLHCRARKVRRKLEHRGGIRQLLPPIGQLIFQQLTAQQLALPARIVDILDGKFRQWRRTAFPVGLIQGRQFVHEHAPGPPIRYDVMGGHQQHVLLPRELQQSHSQQRSAGQIK